MKLNREGVTWMDYMAFLEALVNAQTEDERMALVKEHAETFMQADGEGDLKGSLDEMTAALEEANTTITRLKQEIKDRFFGKYKESEDKPEDDTQEDEPQTKEASLKDLGFGQKTY
jgi:hypothetical protein